MKSIAAAVALLGFATESDALINSFSRKILNSANNRHHIKYGHNGVDYIEAHETSKYRHRHARGKKLKSSQHSMLQSNIESVDGVINYVVGGKRFNAQDKSNKLISFLFELQFDSADEAFNSCTLVGTEMVEVRNNAKQAFDEFSINNWSIALMYLPTHEVANSMALYEYCNFSQVLNVATPFTPSDFADWQTYDLAGMGNTMVRSIYAGVVTAKPMKKERDFAKKQKDALAEGTYAAKIFMTYFAFELPPIAEVAAEQAAAIADA